MKTKKPLERLVWVKWIDSVSGNHWETLDSEVEDAMNREMAIESVGWVVHDGKHRLSLSMSKALANNHVSGTLLIPKVAVTEIREIIG